MTTQRINILDAWDVLKANPGTAIGTGWVGAIPCVGAYVIMHGALAESATAWERYGQLVTLAACLLFSVRTVWMFGEGLFGERWKAVFLVVSLEGLMVFMPRTWLALVALAALICINGVATACHTVSQRTAKPEQEEPVLGLNPVRPSSRRLSVKA